MSSGKMKSIRKAREEKRQAKFAEKRENGTAYEYVSIEKATGAKKGSRAYNKEKAIRARKNRSSKSEYAEWASVTRKQQNRLDKLAESAKNGKKKATA
jgi:endo-1,4-beta-D-glucanase Y